MAEIKLLYERKSAKKPFLPSIGYKSLNRPPKKLLNEAAEDEELKRETFSKDQEFIDAETGEPLALTKAKWTAKEGRLSLNAKTILNMGTGMLDLNVRSAQSHQRPTLSISTQAQLHPLVAKFLQEGPLTPMMHQNWNPLTDEVRLNTAEDDASSSQFGSASTSSLKKQEALQLLATPTNNETRDMIEKYNAEYKELIPAAISLSQTSNWNAVYEKTFNDLYSMAEQLERNKSLTLERRNDGGLAAIRRTCQQLARVRVKYMQEVIQAIQDEEKKEKQRELNELESFEKKELLKEIRKQNREERKKGKLYIEALQRDQEILYMSKLKDAGLLW